MVRSVKNSQRICEVMYERPFQGINGKGFDHVKQSCLLIKTEKYYLCKKNLDPQQTTNVVITVHVCISECLSLSLSIVVRFCLSPY